MYNFLYKKYSLTSLFTGLLFIYPLFLIILYKVNIPVGNFHLSISHLILGLLLLYTFYRNRSFAANYTTFNLAFGFIFLMITYCVIAALFAENNAGMLNDLFYFLFCMALLFLFFLNRFYLPEKFLFLTESLVVTTAIISFLAIIEFHFDWHPLDTQHFAALYKMHTAATFCALSFDNPNNLTTFLALMLPFVLLFYMVRKNAYNKKWLIAIIIAILLAMFYSGGRIPLLLLPIQFALFYALPKKNTAQILRKFFLSALVITIVTIFFVIFYRLHVHSANGSPGGLLLLRKGFSIISLGERLTLFLNGSWIILQHGGLGLGAKGFTNYLASHYYILPFPFKHNVYLTSPHNLLLEMATNYSIYLLFLYIYIIFYITKIAFKSLRLAKRSNDAFYKTFSTFVIVLSITYLIVPSTISSYMTTPENWLTFSLLVISGCLLQNFSKNHSTPAVAISAKVS